MAEGFAEVYLNWFTDDDEFPFFIQFGGHERDLYIHSHRDFNELVIVTEGSAVHIVNSEEYPIQKGDVFVVGNDTVHGYRNAENFHICNIMYRHDRMFSGSPDISSCAGYHALFVLEPRITKEQSFRSRLRLKRENYAAVKIILDDMLREYEGSSECRKTMLTAQFARLSAMLSRLYSFDGGGEAHDMVNIAKAVSYIENHFEERISVEELAKISHYSVRHFVRVFKKAYNYPPAEYIINLRISRACAVLRDTGMTISEAAAKCGFDSVNYFSRIFKKRTGLSPTEYKNLFS